jgi:iron-sulfur cluster assembly protein
MYTLEYADTVDPTSIRCDLPLGVTLFLQRGSLLYLIGMTIDYTEEDTQEGFVFRNPNEQGRCGCGESFHV